MYIVFWMIAFSIFGLPVYWYWIFYLISFIFAYLFFLFLKKQLIIKNSSKAVYQLLNDSLDDLFLYIVLWVLIWGRLGHVLIYDLSYYLNNPLHVFYIWEWGMSFIGGIIGVLCFWYFLARKYKFQKSDLLLLLDSMVLPASFGIMLWRIGNFLNQELYGRDVFELFPSIPNNIVKFFSQTKLFYIYETVDSVIRVNTNILSSFFEWFVIFAFSIISWLYFIKNKKIRIWFLSSFFIIFYSLFRFVFEYLREDSQMEIVWLFSKSQWFFLFFFVFGLFLLISVYKRKTK